jgi:hypothetical protein
VNALRPRAEQTAAPRLPSLVLLTAISRAMSSIDFGHGVDLAPAEQTLLLQREAELAMALEPASVKFVGRQVELLWRMLGSEPMSDLERGAYLSKYIDVLAGLPAFALQKAVSEFVAGQEGNGLFVPRVAQVRPLAENYAHPFRTELLRIRRVLGAAPSRNRDPSEAARIPDSFAALLDSIKLPGVGFVPRSLEALAAESAQALVISPELRRVYDEPRTYAGSP